MWEKGESTRGCTEDDYVATAVADMVAYIYLQQIESFGYRYGRVQLLMTAGII